MNLLDRRGCSVGGAERASLQAYERALATMPSWRSGADEREQLHLAAIAAAPADDYQGAKARLGELLRLQPRDVLAQHVAQSFDYFTGDLARMNDRVAAILPAWSHELPGFHAVQGMHAFSLEECGEYARAEQVALSTVALDPLNARAHAAWAPHVDDGFCSFSDLHAMLAFVGARDWDRAQHLERALARRQSGPTRHGETTRPLGLPAGRALIAFGRGNDTQAIPLLASLPALAHRLGGSHAQRDALNLTLQHATERARRPARQARFAPAPIAAQA